MRTPRKRMLRFTVNGVDTYVEQAGDRTVAETQHWMATEVLPGAFVRVQEFYIGGAKAKVEEVEEEEP